MGKKIKTGKTGGTGFPACAEKGEVTKKRRTLPHWYLDGSTYFVTFRLKSGMLSDHERQLVLDAIKHFHGLRYWITVAVIMTDHVHFLVHPLSHESKVDFSLSKILQGIKGFSAREINKSRNTRGPVWQDESFDRIVRDNDEYLEKWQYIRNNPVKSGLCQASEDYRFLWEPGETSSEMPA